MSTIEEYRAAIKVIDDESYQKKRALAKEHALSNNTISVGDVIGDHRSNIIVKVIQYTHGKTPECAYTGPVLTKSGNARKDGAISTIYQSSNTLRLTEA